MNRAHEEAFWRDRGCEAAALARRIQDAPLPRRESIRAALAAVSAPIAARSDWPAQAALLHAAAPFLAVADADATWRQLERAARPLQQSAPAVSAPSAARPTRNRVDIAIGWQWLLQGFDRSQRRKHGAFYTPPPLARFVIRCAQQLASRHFDSACHVVDPAAGTGIFLREWLRQRPLSQRSLSEPCLRGWEMLPATAAVGNQLLHEQSQTTGGARHDFILHGSALSQQNVAYGHSPGGKGGLVSRTGREPPSPGGKGGLVSRTGREPPSPLIILGNPPYSNFRSANDAGQSDLAWLSTLLEDYKQGLSERKHNLGDDFILFFRWAQHQIETAGRGVVAFVTNNAFLTGITHRVMRRSLLQTFDQAWILNLHGEQFQAVPGDENVFGIRQGVAVSIWIRHGDQGLVKQRCQTPNYASIRGGRSEKLAKLERAESPLDDIHWEPLSPADPEWLCARAAAPSAAARPDRRERYLRGPRITELAKVYVSGVQTKADRLFIDMDRDVLAARMQRLLAHNELSDLESIPRWLAPRLGQAQFQQRHLLPIQVAPLDRRWIYYDPQLLGRARWDVMRHLLHAQRGLVFMRQSTNPGVYDHFLATPCLVTDRIFRSRHGAPYVAPWRLAPDAASELQQLDDDPLALGNLTPAARRLTPSVDTAAPESVWHYCYAVTHATSYRVDHAAELARDFPRIPPATDHDQFVALAQLGSRLAELHCTEFRGGDSPSQQRAPSDGDEWRIGGVDVLRRWRRQRRELTAEQQAELELLAWLRDRSHELVTEINRVYDADRAT